MDIIKLSLDKDIVDAQERYGLRSDISLLLLQIVRLLRGKSLQVVETPLQGWSPDGKVWYPSEPGTVPPHNDGPEHWCKECRPKELK